MKTFFNHLYLKLMTGLVLLPGTSWAALPKVDDPSRTGTNDGLLKTIQNHAYDGFALGGLIIAAIAFIAVAWYGISVFSEVQKGRKTWTDFGAVVIVGVVLLVLVIWLLTKGNTIL